MARKERTRKGGSRMDEREEKEDVRVMCIGTYGAALMVSMHPVVGGER